MTDPGIRYDPKSSEFYRQLNKNADPIAKAVTKAFRDAAKQLQAQGRADIAVGLGRRLQAGFTARAYPRTTYSLSPKIFGKHKLGYLNIFERSGTIRPKNRRLLWLPLPAAPAKIGGAVVTPALFVRQIGPLVSMERRGKAPMLGAYVSRLPGAGRPASLATLRTGARNARRRQAQSAFGARRLSPAKLVPIFVGVPSAHIAKRLNVSAAYDRARAQLPRLYRDHFRQEYNG